MNFVNRLEARLEALELNRQPGWFRIIYLLIPLIIYYLVGDATEIVLWALINNMTITGDIATFSAVIKAVIYLMGALLSLIILKKMALNEITYVTNKKINDANRLKIVIFAVAASLVSAIVLNMIFYYAGWTKMSAEYERVSANQYGISLVAGVIIYGLCSPFIEEVIFRGIIYNRLKRIFPVTMSIVLSALLFGMFHGNIVQGVYGFLMGFLITLFYERYNSFLIPVLMHMVANISIYVLSYVVWK